MVQKSLDKTSPPPSQKFTTTPSAHNCCSLSSILFWILALFSLLLSPIVYMVLTRAGLGQYFGATFPNTTIPFTTLPIISNDISDGEIPLQVVAELPYPPGNVAVSAKGRVFFTFNPEYYSAVSGQEVVKVAEVNLKTKGWTPFPSMDQQRSFITILSLRIDQKDRLWLLDYAAHGTKGAPSLLAYDLRPGKAQTPLKNYSFPDSVAGFGSMLNDFQVDPSGKFIYIADTSILAYTPAIIVYNVEEDRSYRLLSGQQFLYGISAMLRINSSWSSSITAASETSPSAAAVCTGGADGSEKQCAASGSVGQKTVGAVHNIRFGPLGLKIHVDSIALDRSGSVLYFGALTGNLLLSISTSHLLYFTEKIKQAPDQKDMLEQQVVDQVRVVSREKPVTDGISCDAVGNLWLTTVEHSSLSIAVPISGDGEWGKAGLGSESEVAVPQGFRIVKVIENRQLLRWPDGLSFGPDGLYIAASALQHKLGRPSSPSSSQSWPLSFSQTNISEFGPFHILRLSRKQLQKVHQVLHPKKKFSLPAAGH
eukprot:gene30590-39859_t